MGSCLGCESMCDLLREPERPSSLWQVVLKCKSSSEGVAYIQTANLDGETNLKERNAVAETQAMTDEEVGRFSGVVVCEPPDEHLYKFNSKMW